MYSKKYILICGIANIISGAPIYYKNKIDYLEDKKWNVTVLPFNSGIVYIDGFEKYNHEHFEFLQYYPFVFNKKKIDEYLQILSDFVLKNDQNDFEDIVIETGTDYTAYWGELLAEKINAKHIVVFLDENNAFVNENTYEFFKFKYMRKELACISHQSLSGIFGKYFDLLDANAHVLTACCSNSVGNVVSSLKDSIPKGDYVIGSIGRLEKGYVVNIIDSVINFAKMHHEKKFVMCFIGGSDNSEVINQIKKSFSNVGNIKLYITGFLWPIPKDIFECFDVFISGAGSANVSANMDVPTIRMDVINNKPLGIINDVLNETDFTLTNEASIEDYLDYLLLKGNSFCIKNRITIEEQHKWINECFDDHITFLNNSTKNKNYFDTSNLIGNDKKRILKVFFEFFSLDTYLKLKKIIKHGDLK